MAKKQLEIRGIRRHELSMYLLHLGAIKASDNVYKGIGWSCKLGEEKSFQMFQSIIPLVDVFFEADDFETLDDVIASFRKKTFRAGG